MSSLSDVEWIFVVLIVLYFLESLVWVRPGVSVFASRRGSFRNRKPAMRLTGNDRGQLMLGGLAPTDMTLLCHEMPVSITGEGVVAFVPMSPINNERPHRSGDSFRWSELADCRSNERDVIAGGRTVCHMNNAAIARRFADQLSSLARTPENERAEKIERFREAMYDVQEIRDRVEDLSKQTRWIRPLASMLLIWIGPIGVLLYYGILPVSRDAPTTVAYLVMLFLLWWGVAACIFTAHRRLFREDRTGRFKLVACSLLSPAVPLRSIDYLSRELLATDLYHPLAVSAAIDSSEQFRSVAERTMRDIEHPIAPEMPNTESAATAGTTTNEVINAIVMDSRASDWDLITKLLSDSKIPFEELLAAPEPEDDASMEYCPRCHQQFEIENAACDQCGGRETLPLRV
ncbi:hypothetical protein [Rhodopirellula sp. SWK7]|uniref:hypothetical protein n=1 Tax=Rhodopirellula sp. SWK7 TaxID=595460 RepID=UPI0002BE40BB|nr:hypothetical protein [Rhodopirellula sp. SWK7]EMI44430.1 membrane protein [Rhodopirellula sp. SWK7]